MAWLDALFQAMQELYRRKSSLRISPENNSTNGCVVAQSSGSSVHTATDADLGKRAPTLARLDSVSRCKDCGGSFGVMRRKHHCHACGMVSR